VTADNFEKGNVLCGSKLRTRWDQLLLKSQRKKPVNSKEPPPNYEGKKYIVYGGQKMYSVEKNAVIPIAIKPQEVADILGLPEYECIWGNGVPLESKGIDPLKYEIVRPTEEMFDMIYQHKLQN
jgi:hypothetical protein